MKAVHIFHHNDLDGKASGSLMYEYFYRYRDDVRRYFLHEIDYSHILDQEVFPEDIIVFVDYSFSTIENLNYLINLINNGYEVIWIDHHKSSLDIASSNYEFKNAISKNDKGYYNISTSKCATLLVYEYIMSKITDELYHTIPDIIFYIDSYDSWKHNKPFTEEFVYGISSLDYTAKNFIRLVLNNKNLDIFNYNNKVIKAERIFIDRMISNGSIIKKYVDHKNKIERYNNGFEFVIMDENYMYRCFALNIHSNSLAFGDLINSYNIVCPFIRTNNNQWKYSLFTASDEIDCSYLAKTIGTIDNLGGGGHKKAAGFQTKKCIFDSGTNIIIGSTMFSGKPKIIIY